MNKSMKPYIITTAADLAALGRMVCTNVEMGGYAPVGGPFLAVANQSEHLKYAYDPLRLVPVNQKTVWCQAMYKKPAPQVRASRDSAYTADFEVFWKTYPARPGKNKKAAFRCWNARLKELYSAAEMIDGARRYAAYCDSENTTGTKYALQPTTFLGPDLHFQNTYKVVKRDTGIQHIPDDELADWAKRNGGPEPKAQAGYDFKAYRKDLEAWAAKR